MIAAPGDKLSHASPHEAYRRIMAGQAPTTLSELTQEILDWCREALPGRRSDDAE